MMNRATWKWMKTVSGVVVTATAVLAMFAGVNVARADSVTRGIQAENDDVEEYLNIEAIHGWGGEYVQGGVYLNSSDLEVGDDDGGGLFWQAVAMQYDQLGIPQGATINSAKLTLQVDEDGISYSSNAFTILAEAADDAAVFSGEGYYGTPFDVTTRARSAASVGWQPPTATAVGLKVDTPDIAALIQEVVNRPGWSDNNRLTLMIYPDCYLALPDPATGGWTTVSSNFYEAGPGADSATLTVDFTAGSSGPIPGDTNDNGFVDDDDLAVLLSNWEQDPGTITTWALGNFTEASLGDTNVDDDDLAVLLGNWTGSPPPAGAAVPEPTTMALLALGALTLGRRRRR